MSVLNDWAIYVAKCLSADSELVSSTVKHGGEIGSAREAIIKQVLKKFLPAQYEIGTGEIVSSDGSRSRQIDIVIARKDFPALRLPSGSKVYLLESVLATIEVKSKLTKENLFSALDNCMSVSSLNPNVVKGRMDELANRMELTKVAPGKWQHSNPLETARFDLLPRPPSYIFGFKGYPKSTDDFSKAIEEWVAQQRDISMSDFPALICTEGCYLWRNAKPYILDENVCAFGGVDDVPLRLLVLHLLYTLTKRIPMTPDENGITPNLDAYLLQMPPPENIMFKIGKSYNQ